MAPSEKPRVVRIIARLNVGGPAQHAAHLSAGLRDRFDTILVAGAIGADEADLSGLARERGVAIEMIPRLGREIHPVNDASVLRELYRLLRRVRPAIVHTHTAKAGTVGRIAAVLAGVPIRVHTFHGHVLRGYFGPLKTAVFTWIERLLARFTTCIIAISETQADDLSNLLRLPRERITVIPLGLELERFRPGRIAGFRDSFRAEIDADDAPVLACVGRLVPIKNHALLLRAFAEVRRAGGKALLVIAGGGSEEVELHALARELDIQDSVRFLGWRSDLERIYAGSDAVVLSSDNEGTPVCLIEALTAGKPVVSTDVGGVRDVLDNGRLGTLVPSGDASALSRALLTLLDDLDRQRDVAAVAAVEIPERFSRERLLRDVSALYESLLARQRSSKTAAPDL